MPDKSAQGDGRVMETVPQLGIDVYCMYGDVDVLRRQQTSLLSVESDYKVQPGGASVYRISEL